MKIWKISWRDNSFESHGYSYGLTKNDAIANKPLTTPKDDDKTFTRINVGITASGVISALNEHGSHNDNG